MDRVKWNDFMEILSDDLNRCGEYLIAGFRDMVSDFITNGDAAAGLAVTAQAVPNMTVYVKAGRLYQKGQQGTLAADSKALNIAAAHNSYSRIDRVVAQYQEVEDLPETRNVMTDVVSRNIVQKTVKTRIAGTVVFQVLQGVPASAPVPVNVPEGWISLAKITVPANATKIQQSNIVSDAPTLLGFFNHNHNGAGGGQKISYKNLTDTPAKASQAEAEAGTDDNKVMTPLKVLQSILKNAPKQDLSPYAKLASPAFTGTPTAPTASKTTNNTQLATTAFVHALAGAVNNGGIVAQSLGQNGYVKFANGLILQWGYITRAEEQTIIYPITFTQIYIFLRCNVTDNGTSASYRSVGFKKSTNASTTLLMPTQIEGCDWIAVGH